MPVPYFCPYFAVPYFEQVWNDPDGKLVREFKACPLPRDNEATGLFGRCKVLTPSRGYCH